MKYHEMTENYIFREFECGLFIEETAELCLKSVRTVKECKRLMRNQCRLELGHTMEWYGFKMCNSKLE